MSGAAAKAMADAQRAADRAHHEKRVAWLESPSPMWADGERVALWERSQMLISSRNYLSTGEGFNHCHCEPRCNETEPTNG